MWKSVVMICFHLSIVSRWGWSAVAFTTSPSWSGVGKSLRENDRLLILQATIDTSFMWNAGLSFGKGDFRFYQSFNKMMGVFPVEDREAFPDLFRLPRGVYEVSLRKPLGIVFEEIDSGRGLYIQDLVPDGNASVDGTVRIGDILVGITAVKIVGAKYERRLIPARNFDFDTMVGAIASNEEKWGCDDVVLMVERPGEADSVQVAEFMQFFEPPFDNPWKQRQ